MRPLLTVLVLLLTAPSLDAQFFFRYEKRGKSSFLSIRIGSYGHHHSWYPAHYHRSPLVYTTGTVVYVPTYGGLWPGVTSNTPWYPPPPATSPPSSGPLAAKYTRYALPPPATGAALDVRIQALVDAGFRALREARGADAVRAFREAILLGPESPALESYFAMALAATGDGRHADKALASALARVGTASPLLPEDVKELFAGAEAFDKMLAALEKGAPHGRLTAAFLHLAGGNNEKAKTLLDAILTDAPKDAAAKKLRSLVE